MKHGNSVVRLRESVLSIKTGALSMGLDLWCAEAMGLLSVLTMFVLEKEMFTAI